MIWDGAGFHRSRPTSHPDNITLVPLPAYSPELNPIEILALSEESLLVHRAYADYDAWNKPPWTLGNTPCWIRNECSQSVPLRSQTR